MMMTTTRSRIIGLLSFQTLLMLPTLAGAFSMKNNQRVFLSTPVSKWPKRLVGDCMSKVPVTLRADQSVQDAMALLYANGITGAPVINESLQVVGVVSNFDFLWEEAFEGSLLPIDGDAQHVAAYATAARKICAKTVQEAMSDNDLYTVTPTTTMKHAAELMTKVKLHHLPVIDDRNGDKLVGILTSSDVMQDLLHIVRNLPPAVKKAIDEEAESLSP